MELLQCLGLVIRKSLRLKIEVDMRIGQFVEYKGYVGTIEYSPEDNIYYGHLLNIEDSISYDGSSVEELCIDSQGAVDFYTYWIRLDEREE